VALSSSRRPECDNDSVHDNAAGGDGHAVSPTYAAASSYHEDEMFVQRVDEEEGSPPSSGKIQHVLLFDLPVND